MIAIVAKAPEPGLVKTRLCPPLSAGAAAELSRAFVLDTIEQVRSLPAVARAVAYAPDGGRRFFEDAAPDFSLLPQRGADLGQRMMACLDSLLGDGHPGVLLIGSDMPTLPASVLRRAVDSIAGARADVVLGPSEDGGYYLIGLRARRPELFEDMPWSTSAVLGETLRRARALGLSVELLPTWFDVDTPADLARLVDSLAASAEPAAPHTRRFFEGDRS